MVDVAVTAAPAEVASGARSAGRNSRIDDLRVLLTMLVVLHHSAIAFGAQGGWYLKEPRTITLTTVLLTIFCTVNQAFFMGFFFLLAGYFTTPAYERKGAARFLGDRLLRLGIPLLVYGFLIAPMTIALAATSRGEPFFPHLSRLIARGFFESGPLWFVLTLLVFSGIYILLPSRPKPATSLPQPYLNDRSLFGAALVTGALAWLIRLVYPVGESVFNLQFGYFASYIVLFGAGCWLARRRELEHLDAALARRWWRVALMFLPLLFVYAILAGAIAGKPFPTQGGLSGPALAYAFWEPFVAWGVILKLLSAAPGKSWLPRGIASALHRSAYGAYIVHPPIVVGLTLLIAPWGLPAVANFIMVGVAACSLSFCASYALTAIPKVRAVL